MVRRLIRVQPLSLGGMEVLPGQGLFLSIQPRPPPPAPVSLDLRSGKVGGLALGWGETGSGPGRITGPFPQGRPYPWRAGGRGHHLPPLAARTF